MILRLNSVAGFAEPALSLIYLIINFIHLIFLDLLLHYTAPPVCNDRYGEIQTEGAAFSASRHLERTIMQSTSIFHVPLTVFTVWWALNFGFTTRVVLIFDDYPDMMTRSVPCFPVFVDLFFALSRCQEGPFPAPSRPVPHREGEPGGGMWGEEGAATLAAMC